MPEPSHKSPLNQIAATKLPPDLDGATHPLLALALWGLEAGLAPLTGDYPNEDQIEAQISRLRAMPEAEAIAWIEGGKADETRLPEDALEKATPETAAMLTLEAIADQMAELAYP